MPYTLPPDRVPTFGTAYPAPGDIDLLKAAVADLDTVRLPGLVSRTGGGKEALQSVSAGATTTLNLANANVFVVTATANLAISFTGFTASVASSWQVIVIRQGFTVTFPAGMTWLTGVQTANGTLDVFDFETYDAGTTILAAKSGGSGGFVYPYKEVALTSWGSGSAVVPATFGERTQQYRKGGQYMYSAVTGLTQVRLAVYMVTNGGSANNEFRCQWSTDQSTWNYFDGGTGPSVVVGNTIGLKLGSFVTMSGIPDADMFFRVYNGNGDGTTTVSTFNIYLQFR